MSYGILKAGISHITEDYRKQDTLEDSVGLLWQSIDSAESDIYRHVGRIPVSDWQMIQCIDRVFALYVDFNEGNLYHTLDMINICKALPPMAYR